MKIKSEKQTIVVGLGKGKGTEEYPPGAEVELSDAEAKRLIDRGLAYDPAARAKAEKEARQEAADAGKKKSGGGKSAD